MYFVRLRNVDFGVGLRLRANLRVGICVQHELGLGSYLRQVLLILCVSMSSHFS